MTIPPVHNFIVQWGKEGEIFLNIFDSPRPGFFYISNPKKGWVPFVHNTYEEYIEEVFDRDVPIYIPTTATTVEEALQLHPELLI